MKKSYLTGALIIALSFTLFMSCDKKVAKLASQPAASSTGPSPCDTVTYTQDIKAIIDLNCGTATGCHTASGAQFNGGVSLETYADVVSKADRIKVRAVDEGTMPQAPQPPLNQAQKDLIVCWVGNGKKQ